MASPSSVETLKAYSDVSLSATNRGEFAASLMRESDRAVVVILGSILDHELGRLIRARFRPMTDAKFKDLRLFAFDGPVGTFGARINVAYAMNLIDESIAEELHDIRHMRNACAHSVQPINLEMPVLANVCKRLFRDGYSVIRPVANTALGLKCALIAETFLLLSAFKSGRRKPPTAPIKAINEAGHGPPRHGA